jgi:hypothetical protein
VHSLHGLTCTAAPFLLEDGNRIAALSRNLNRFEK